MAGYVVTPCECGHAPGDHKSARTTWPHPSTPGICLIAGCECREYTPDQSSTIGGRKDDSHAPGLEAPSRVLGDRRAA